MASLPLSPLGRLLSHSLFRGLARHFLPALLSLGAGLPALAPVARASAPTAAQAASVASASVADGIRAATPASDPQVVGGVDVSRWRGFNLLEKFTLARNAPYVEDDFKWIRELGFNFVRLPIDYRCYTEKGDWLKFDEKVLREIDQAIAYGDRYDLHVCINLHRAPGFCINPPEEPTNLWSDERALEAFAAHWSMFAERYRHVPAARLSFNLLNEPTRCTREQYLKVFSRAIESIQKVDTKRLILVDGHNVGKDPSPEFLRYANIVQSTRGYHPGTISHYKANWVKGWEKHEPPVWPIVRVPGYLYGPVKKELREPLVLRGDFPAGTAFEFSVVQFSSFVRLVATANGRKFDERRLAPSGDASSAWKKANPSAKHSAYEPVESHVVRLVLPAAALEVALDAVEGDWVKFGSVVVVLPDGRRHAQKTDQTWGRRQAAFEIAADGSLRPPPGVALDAPLKEYLKPWLDISARGAPVFVGEWGCFNKTPHPVALAWMKSWLLNWKQARFGWALWEFRGAFGILDSRRTDVVYEDFHGHKLDRAMLELLQKGGD